MFIHADDAVQNYSNQILNSGRNAGGQVSMNKYPEQSSGHRMQMEYERKLHVQIAMDISDMYSLEKDLLTKTPGTV